MWPLTTRANAPDPAPSMWRFRLNRMFRRRWVRRAALRWLPMGAIVAGAAWSAAHFDLRAIILEQTQSLRAVIAERPEFAVRQVEITGASALVRADAKAALALPARLSSLDVAPRALRARVEALGWVASAQVSLEAPETLRIHLVERAPAALWRRDARLALIDRQGVEIAPALARVQWPRLPLVVGPGADVAVAEALELFSLAPSLAPRLRGFVRVGGRRWDIVFDDLRILLPETGALEVISRIAALDRDALLLDRDVDIIDARDPDSLTLRLGELSRQMREERRAERAPGEDT